MYFLASSTSLLVSAMVILFFKPLPSPKSKNRKKLMSEYMVSHKPYSSLPSKLIESGTMAKLKRSDAEEMVEKNGGKLVTGVSSKLNYLVVGEDAGSKLEKAKKISTIKIINEDQFLKMVTSS